MNEEYETIRQGLLGLLCVGSPIKYLYYGDTVEYSITIQYIKAFYDGGITLLGHRHVDYDYEEIEMYKGELYIWPIDKRNYPYRSEKRISKLAELIESKETLKFYGSRI